MNVYLWPTAKHRLKVFAVGLEKPRITRSRMVIADGLWTQRVFPVQTVNPSVQTVGFVAVFAKRFEGILFVNEFLTNTRFTPGHVDRIRGKYFLKRIPAGQSEKC